MRGVRGAQEHAPHHVQGAQVQGYLDRSTVGPIGLGARRRTERHLGRRCGFGWRCGLHPAVAAVGAGNRVRASSYAVQRLIRQARERQIAPPPAAHLRHWRAHPTVHRVPAHVQHRVDRRRRVCAPHGDVCARRAGRRGAHRSARQRPPTDHRRGHRVRPAPPRPVGALARARSVGNVCQLAHRPPDPGSAAHAEATSGMAAAGRPEKRPGAVHGHDAAGYAPSRRILPFARSICSPRSRRAAGSPPRCTPTPMSEPFGSASADDAASPADCPSHTTAAPTRAPSSSSSGERKRTFSST